jgi:ubiquinone biosynthesis protein UbiJ
MKYLGDYITEEKKAQIRALESAALGTDVDSAEREVIYLKIKVLLLEAQLEFIEQVAQK